MDDVELLKEWYSSQSKVLHNAKNEVLRAFVENVRQSINKEVIGQENAILELTDYIKLSLRRRKGQYPVGSALFAGSTGVGKTETARCLARHLFHSKDNILQIDCSELSTEIDVTKLIGAAPGYMGFEQGGMLTEWVKKHPKSLILFDEIEKAHPKIYNLCLQILNDGRITDNHAKTVDMTQTFVVFTTNIGATVTNNISLSKTSPTSSSFAIERYFKPEFLGRLGRIITFDDLNSETIKSIVLKVLDDKKAEYDLDYNSDEYVDTVIEHINPKLGVRNVKMIVDKFVVLPML